jgi:hypothetical protein
VVYDTAQICVISATWTRGGQLLLLRMQTGRNYSEVPANRTANFLAQRRPWEADSRSVVQEIPHYHVHKSLPIYPSLSQLKSIHTPSHCFLKIHLNIILQNTGLPSKLFSLVIFRLKFCMHFSLPNAWHMSLSSHPPWFYYSDNIGEGYKLIFSSAPYS